MVCALGPGFFEDLEAARKLRPEAPITAVNEAGKAVQAFALFSLHPEKGRRWKAVARQAFGKAPPLHSGGKYCDVPDRERRRKYPLVDYWWKRAAGGGSSGWAAAKMARLMGFEEIILVGVPMVFGNYADGSFAKGFREGHRHPDGSILVEHYRQAILEDADWHEGVRSMGGWTREVFGGPS